MTQAAPFDDLSLSRYRAYLRVLAEIEIGRWGRLGAMLDPSDLVQETLLRAVRAQKQLRSATEPVVLGWLRAILARQLANLFRRLRAEKRDVRRERPLERVLEESAEQISAAALKIAPSPSAQCRDEECLLRILEAIAALPDPQRQAFLLRHVRGLHLEEVCRNMGRSPASVAGLLRRAAASLRRELAEYRDSD
ncbi:MAG: sigma-70 family RNA polymerase sigma factor [Planctomycetota bacterium]